MSYDLHQRFAQDWTCQRTRNRFGQLLLSEPKSLHAFATLANQIEPEALLICKPLLANRELRLLWQKRWRQVPTLRVKPDRYRQLISRQPAVGLAALVAQREYQQPPSGAGGLWIALRHVRNVGNLGTLIRSLDALCGTATQAGSQQRMDAGLILIGNTLDPWDPHVVRASMGSVLRVPIARMTHHSLAAWSAKYPHWRIVAADGNPRHQALHQHDFQLPTIAIFGHERHGLDPADRAVCHDCFHIPQTGWADSLNVAMAGTVLCYEASRARQ